jgi:hypothetical protein
MKRFAAVLAAALAVLMLGIVSVAADDPSISSEAIYVASPDGIPCAVEHTNGRIVDTVEPGSTVYFVIEGASRAEDLSNRYARVLFTDGDSTGEDYVGTPSIEYRMLYDAGGTRQVGYSYVVALPVLDVQDDNMHTVRARVGLSRLQAGSLTFSFYVQKDSGIADAQTILCEGENLYLSFAEETDYVRLRFGDTAQFTVATAGQAGVNVGVSFASFTDLTWSYPSADLRCISWRSHPIFNRIGTLALTAVSDQYCYEIRSGALVDLTDTYSEEEGAFLIRTRRLGSYVISDQPLGEAENTEPRPNPPTGFFSKIS